eukprot:2978240-Prymnesium_polylepis.4
MSAARYFADDWLHAQPRGVRPPQLQFDDPILNHPDLPITRELPAGRRRHEWDNVDSHGQCLPASVCRGDVQYRSRCQRRGCGYARIGDPQPSQGDLLISRCCHNK